MATVDVANAQIQMLVEAVTRVAVRNERFRRFGTAHATQIALGHAAITCSIDHHRHHHHPEMQCSNMRGRVEEQRCNSWSR